MRWLPYEIITFTIPQSPQEAAAQLSAIVEPRKLLRFWEKHATFDGVVDQYSFQIRRIITGRNSRLPEIDGRFALTPEGTCVNIRFQITPLAAMVTILWFGVAVFLEIALLVGVLTQGASPFPLLFPVAITAFGFLMMSTCFWPEVDKSTELLKSVWKVPPTVAAP